MKRVIIVHGWGGDSKGCWIPWLKSELEKKGFEVITPDMPDTDIPKIESWTSNLRKVVEKPTSDTFFIGHSIGCQTIMRYLETLSENEKVGGVVFVAGWFDLTDETWDESYTKEIANPWIKTKINFNKIKSVCNKFVDIASDDDPYVSLDDSKIFKNKLGAKIIVEKGLGHIDSEELPSALDAVLEMAK